MGMPVTARTSRVVLAGVLFALVAVIRPAGVVAQDAPLRWDGSLEELSSAVPWLPAGPLPAEMSRHPLSADGRWLVYMLDVPNDPYPSVETFFIHDRLAGSVQHLIGAHPAAAPVISADGNHVAAPTCDSAWLDDPVATCDIILIDQRSFALAIGGRLPEAAPNDGPSTEPMLSRDGRFLVFRTESTMLMPAGAAPGQIALRDRDADGNGVFDEPGGVTIHVVSVSSFGEPGNGPSSDAQISADGQIVVFRSAATNLVPDDTNEAADVFLHDRQSGETRRINVGWDGQQATPTLDSPALSMSEDGRYVTFAADDWYLMNPPAPFGEDNGVLDVHVYDRVTGTLQRVEVGHHGTPGNGHTYWPTISADGRYIAMVSVATNIEEPSTVTPGRAHVYVFDRVTHQITRVSKTPQGVEPNADAAFAAMSADGSFVTFVSRATNLAPLANGAPTIYGAGHLSVSPETVTLPSQGGEATLTIAAQQYVPWNIEFSDYTWLQVSSPPWGNRGPASFGIYAYANPDPTPRTVSLRIGAQTVVVTQEGGLTLTSVSPSSGPDAGGTPVTITGSGFEPDMTLFIDGIPTAFEFVDLTTIRAVTPPHAPGSAYVAVSTTDFRYAWLGDAFRYLDTTPPEVYVFVNGEQRENGWYTSDVVIDWVVYDPQSSVTWSPGCMQTFVRTDTKGSVFTCSASSDGGTTVKEVYIQRDTTPPIAHIAAPRNTLYPLNSTQTASPMCLDDTSGIASCLASIPFGQPFDTSTTGYHSYTLEVVDNAGWRSEAVNVYAVSNGECDARPAEMIAWWPGDGDFRDVIGGQDGVLAQSQTPEFLAGMSRQSMYFRVGDGRGVHVGDAPALRLTTGLTLSAWISNWNGTQNQISVIAGKEGEYLLGRHYDGRIHYSIANATPGWGWVDTGIVAEWNVWTHLALTYDGDWVRLYKNGDLAYSKQGSGPIGDADPNQNDFTIGIRQATQPGSEFGGTIDNVQVVGRAMFQSEIQHAFLSTPHGHCLESSSLAFVSGSLRAAYGQASAEIAAQLTRDGVPQPGTPVYVKFRGTALAPAKTDASGIVRVTVALPEGLAVNTYPNAVEARVDEDLVVTASAIAADFVVEKATPVVTWSTPAPIVYGTPLNGLQLNPRATALGEFEFSPAFGSVLDAGTHTLSATFSPYEPNNFTTATATVTLVVNRAEPYVSVSGGTFTYDGTPKEASGYVVGNENTWPGLGPLTFTYDGSPEPPVNAGTYTVVGTFAGDANYNAASATATLTILKATPVVTASGGTFAYDGLPHGATGAATGIGGAVLAPLTFTYGGSPDVPVNAGTYTVVATFEGDANYTAASDTTTLTITKAVPRISASGGTFTYDGLPHPATYSVTGVGDVSLGPVAVMYSGSPDVPVDAGSYAVVVSYAGDANYSATFTTASIVILKANAEVSAVGGTFIYDGLPHPATGTATGAGGVSLGPLTFSYNGSSNVPVNAGTYSVVASFAGDINHTAATGTAMLTVAKATPRLTASGGTFTYDGAPHPATATATGVGGATLGPLTFTYNGTSNVPVNAGSYAAVISFAGDENYSASFTTASISIVKATAMVTVTGGSFTYDGTPHAATAAVTGPDGVTLGPVTFTYDGLPNEPVNAGTYAVVASFAGDANYDAATGSATLIVTKATPVVTATGGTFVYDGAPHAASGTATGVGASTLGPLTFTYNGAADVPVGAGSYEVVATYAGDPNHESAWATATLTIDKATPVVAVAGGVFTYDGLPHPATGSVKDTAGVDLGTLTFTYNGSASVPVNAGEYAAVGTFDGGANYVSASAAATITIGKASPVVEWQAPAAIVYGTALGAAQLNAAAAIPGTFAYSPAPGTVLSAGAGQPLSVTFTPADAANYTGASASTFVTVLPAPLIVRADDAVKRFGMPLPTFTGTVSGFVNGDSIASLTGALVFTTTATAQSPAGVYPVVAAGVSSPNYSVTFVNGTLTIVRGAVNVAVTTSPEPSGYDQPMTFTATVAASDPVGVMPSGTVRFFDGSTLLGSASLNAGTALLSTAGLSTGTRTIEARCEGDGSFEPGSASSSHVVRSAYWTPGVTVSSSKNPSNVGQSVTLLANVRLEQDDSNVSGSVQFYAGATLLGTSVIHDNRATFTTASLPAGSHAITARYLGSSSLPPSRSRVMVQAVGETSWRDRSTSMSLWSSENPSSLGGVVVLTATVTGWVGTAPSGRILFMVNGEVVGDPAGVEITAVSTTSARVTVTVPGLAHGRHSISATYLGDPTYKGSTAQVAQSVN